MRAQGGPYRTEEILHACRGVLLRGGRETVFRGITTDSRDIEPGDLFVPLRGPNFDGHDFVLPALEAGARGSLTACEVEGKIPPIPTDCVLIQVKDTLLALTDLASAHRNTHSHPLIAVTGSSGKTTVKEMIAAVLGRSHRPLVSEGNYNNMIGLPMTLLGLDSGHDCAVVEAGINTTGEMKHLARAARPDVAVITSIGPVHLEGLGTVENVAREKFRLVQALSGSGVAVLPADDPAIEPLLAGCPGQVVTFGLEKGDFRAGKIHRATETLFEMITPHGTLEIGLRVPGMHNVSNALAAAAACIALGASMDDVAKGLRTFAPPALRMEMIPLNGDRILIRDCYNANPQSVSAALEVLRERGRGTKTLALLADMAELGPEAERLHGLVGRRAAEAGVDRVIFVGRYAGSFQEGFLSGGGDPSSILQAADRDEAWAAIENDIGEFGAILVKGSRVTRMELLADKIVKEG